MSYLTADRIRDAERTLTQQMVTEFGLDLSPVVYDATHFYTWIDTQTPSELAQRGHQNQHRSDLKAVGLALRGTTDFHIPLFHAVYPRNRADSQQFPSVTEELIDRYQTLRAHCDRMTIVYDKGNNSQTNQGALDGSPYGFVGSARRRPSVASRNARPPVHGFPGRRVSGRRRRPLKGSPPSAAQTGRAVFPHPAFGL